MSEHNLLLTKRDLNLMLGLYENVALSFYQIQNWYFEARNFSTVFNRLKRLEDVGFIKRIKVTRFLTHVSNRKVNVIYQLTQDGLAHLQMAFGETKFYQKIPAINTFQIDHDILLADVVRVLKAKYDGFIITNGRYLSAVDWANKIPDAILKMPNDDKFIAIELELQAKSSDRYRDIVAHYRTFSKINKVLYVVSSVSIAHKIQTEILGRPVTDNEFKHHLFEFILLKDLPLAAPNSRSEVHQMPTPLAERQGQI